ncbi:MAG: sulfatase-like hydrolase/transferase [Verrucomicrobiales bacterium]
MKFHFTRTLPFYLMWMLPTTHAEIIATTDFTHRVIEGKTATNISWETSGVAAPGDLTWEPTLPQNTDSTSATLFDTSDTQGHFAPQRNIENQGAWRTDIPLTLTEASIEFSEVSLDWRHFNNAGDFQTANRSADWTITVTGSQSGLLQTATATGQNGLSGTASFQFTSPLHLTNAETYLLTIHVVGTGFPTTGNNTGLDRIVIGDTPPDSRPNILFLMADDQRYDTLGCYGHPVVLTPNIDQLAEEGVRFTNAFVTTPICAASRASVLTGVTERTHGYTFGQPAVPNQLDACTYPKLLRKAGYSTGFIGKYGVTMASTATSHFDSVVTVPGYATSTPYFIEQPDGSFRHSTDVCADYAIEFISAQSPSKPFCLSVSFNAPHARDGATVAEESYPWPPSSDGLYLTETMPDQGLNERWFQAQPSFVQNSINRNRFDWRWDTPEKYDAHLRAHLRMITGIDTAIGRILETLEDEGIADNTIIVYTADNGLFLGARGFAGKWNHYEQSLRVPLVVHDPRLPDERRGRIETAIALNIDFAPTFLEWAETTAHPYTQGLSLVPVIEDPSESTRADFFCEHHMNNSSIPKWRGVRDSRYSYAYYYEEDYEYLHDLQNDPDQWINLASDPSYQTVLEQMRTRSATYQAIYQTRSSVAADESHIIDSEPDGLLDYWEQQNFGSLNHNGTEDTDDDGASDQLEAHAGTDPNNPSSRPRLCITKDRTLSYSPSVPGRLFLLEDSPNLSESSWSTLSLPTTYDSSEIIIDTSSLTNSSRFFRMKIIDPLGK